VQREQSIIIPKPEFFGHFVSDSLTFQFHHQFGGRNSKPAGWFVEESCPEETEVFFSDRGGLKIQVFSLKNSHDQPPVGAIQHW